MSKINLASLPVDHPARTAPLCDIGATYELHAAKGKKTVGAHWRIAKCCYNDLGPAWTETADWWGNEVTG